MIHIAFIQGLVAMAAAASIARDGDASFLPKRVILKSRLSQLHIKYDSLRPSPLNASAEI